MKRRGLVFLRVVLLLALLGAPLLAEAQPPSTHPWIGFLSTTPSDSDLEETRRALNRLGWVDGQNMTIEVRWTEGRSSEFASLPRSSSLKVDVIYAEGSVAAARAAKLATTTIPIVVTSPADLVQTGLASGRRKGWSCSRRPSRLPLEWLSSGILPTPPTNLP
jgi:ABC-type uncharacterized transport system substrate-binding protein